jgi:heptaprenyl diphosphate synthase
MLSNSKNVGEYPNMQYLNLLKKELQDVKVLMLDAINETPSDIRNAIKKLVNGGGKQLRPALVLLAGHLYKAPYDKTRYAAAAVEMLHTATLIHDDLIDNSLFRRGEQTLNAHYSPAITVLSGDITFAIAAKFAALSENVQLVTEFALTLETICQGELNQMLNGHHTIPTVENYYTRINAKTASLFSLCTQAGAILAGCTAKEIENAKTLGHHLGLAFQIVDDVLDFMGNETHLGKPIGGDLKEGLITLPVLHFYNQHPDDARIQAIVHSDIKPNDIKSLIQDLRNSDAADWAMGEANHFIDTALALLMRYPESPYRNAIEEITTFAVKRRY